MLIFLIVTVPLATSFFIHYAGNHRKLDNRYAINYDSPWMQK